MDWVHNRSSGGNSRHFTINVLAAMDDCTDVDLVSVRHKNIICRMVRPEEQTRMTDIAGERASPGCIVSAGESPAPVSAEAPGSGPHEEHESAQSRAGCQKPVHVDRERSGGPQRVVNVEQASSHY